MTTLTHTLEYLAGTVWTEITSDTLENRLRWSGGIQGGGPTDRVAIPGRLECTLDNSQYNSAGSIGLYSPDHTNIKNGWALGAKIRVKLQSGGDTRYWMYRLSSIRPEMGQYRDRTVEVTAKDFMEEFSSRKVSGLAIQTGKRGDELLGTVVAAMPFPPVNTNYDTGIFQFAYAFHDERDEDTACLTVLQKICQSELSYIYTDGDATDGETLHYETHLSRFNTFTASGTISDEMTDLAIVHGVENIYNKVKATTYPVDVDSSLSVLGRIPEEFALEPGETKTIEIRYMDETSSRRVSGAGIVTPEADTDYKMSSIPGSGKNDMNAFLSVVPQPGANTMSLIVSNSGTVSKSYVNLLQVRGHRVTVFDKVDSIKSGTASIADYGEHTLTYNMPYQNQEAFGEAVATEIIRRYENPLTSISGVSFVANRNSTLMHYALTFGIGTRIQIVETVTGLNAGFFINGYDYEIRAGNILVVNWSLERAFNFTPYFTIDHATYGLIDGEYVLAPF